MEELALVLTSLCSTFHPPSFARSIKLLLVMLGSTELLLGVTYFFSFLLIPMKLEVLNSSIVDWVDESKYKPMGKPFFFPSMLGSRSAT